MCVKNSLKEVIYSKNLYNQYIDIIHIFENTKTNMGIEYIPMSYLLLKSNSTQESIYEIIHILLEFDQIDKVEFSRCTSCMTENIINDTHRIKCTNCKEIFYSDFITEKFKLDDRNILDEI